MRPPDGMKFTDVTTDADLARNEVRFSVTVESTVHLIVEGNGLTACCERTPFDLPMLDRLTTNPLLRSCQALTSAHR